MSTLRLGKGKESERFLSSGSSSLDPNIMGKGKGGREKGRTNVHLFPCLGQRKGGACMSMCLRIRKG